MVIEYLALLEQYVPNVWAQAGTILAVFLILAQVLKYVVDHVASKLASKTKTNVDDIIIKRTKKPLFYVIMLLGLRVALIPLAVDGVITKIVASLTAFVFIYILAVTISIVIEVWGKQLAHATKSKFDETILPIIKNAMNILFFIIAFLWVFNIWGIDITPYLAGLGIGGLVLGLALQDSLKNVFGGISLILDKSFNVGDKIRLESGELGEIKEIGLRSTKLLTYDQQLIYIPNGQLANMRIQNYVRPNVRERVTVDFGVEYGSDVETVKKTVLKAVKSMKDISDNPYMDVVFTQLGESALTFQARYFVDDYRKAYEKKLEGTQKIYEALNAAKIGIPFPTRTIYMKKT